MKWLFQYCMPLIAFTSCLQHDHPYDDIHQGPVSTQKNIADNLPLPNLPKPHLTTSYLDLTEDEFTEILRTISITDTTGILFYNKKYFTPKDSFWVIQAVTQPDSFEFHFDIYLLQQAHGRFLVKMKTETFKDIYQDSRVYDTIMDVNFDGREDYMTYSYSGTGCCPRDSREVYLNKPEGFKTKPIHLFNPGFDTTLKSIQEMSYGHPPDISLTKSIWIGDSLHVVEEIYHNMTYEDTFRRYLPDGMYKVYYPKKDSMSLIQELPEAYNAVYDIFWFRDSVVESPMHY